MILRDRLDLKNKNKIKIHKEKLILFSSLICLKYKKKTKLKKH